MVGGGWQLVGSKWWVVGGRWWVVGGGWWVVDGGGSRQRTKTDSLLSMLSIPFTPQLSVTSADSASSRQASHLVGVKGEG